MGIGQELAEMAEQSRRERRTQSLFAEALEKGQAFHDWATKLENCMRELLQNSPTQLQDEPSLNPLYIAARNKAVGLMLSKPT